MRALLSVSDKTGLVELARGLVDRGCEIVSTGGTAASLAASGVPILSVSAVTGFPEMMDGRVKTLHPKIHGGILARRDHPEDREAANRHGIVMIDIVIVNLYPFARAAANPEASFADLIEQVDIGGPSLVRAAAKNFRDVLVVVSPDDYASVLEALDRPEGPPLEFRFELARRAFAHTAAYDSTIAGTLAGIESVEPFRRRHVVAGRDQYAVTLEKVRDLRYGENPHQRAGLWEAPDAPLNLAFVQGKELSFTNLLDLDAARRVAAEFDEPAAVVVKHTNPCGAATGPSPAAAYTRARDADSLAAFGGIVGLNRPIDDDTAIALTSSFIEAVIAPGVAHSARTILGTKANMRVMTFDPREADRRIAAGNPWEDMELRSVLGGVLMQTRDRVIEAREPWPGDSAVGGLRVVTRRPPSAEEWIALRFAWRIMAHVKSNAVIFTGPDRTLAIGAGQMSRVDAVRVAVMKGSVREGGVSTLSGSVAASDAFFPFRDGLDAIAAAGASAVVQPGGSVRDGEVIAAADEHGLAMVFTGRRHFKH